MFLRFPTTSTCFLLSIFLVSGDTAISEEIWPAQPDSPIANYAPTNAAGYPPFPRGMRFPVSSSALFFQHRRDLDTYLKKKLSLEVMIVRGMVKKFKAGRELTSEENITSYSGIVSDYKYGKGYIILFTRL